MIVEQVPFYPLAPLVFFAAAVIFVLEMARHLRVFAVAQRSAVTDQPERRLDALIRYSIVQVKMFRDPGPGLMHAAIFWGRDRYMAPSIVLFGTPDSSWPVDGWLWRLLFSSTFWLRVLFGIGWALAAAWCSSPRATLSRDAPPSCCSSVESSPGLWPRPPGWPASAIPTPPGTWSPAP
jgi:hypothetical protein